MKQLVYQNMCITITSYFVTVMKFLIEGPTKDKQLKNLIHSGRKNNFFFQFMRWLGNKLITVIIQGVDVIQSSVKTRSQDEKLTEIIESPFIVEVHCSENDVSFLVKYRDKDDIVSQYFAQITFEILFKNIDNLVNSAV